jgi:hypothetical protein
VEGAIENLLEGHRVAAEPPGDAGVLGTAGDRAGQGAEEVEDDGTVSGHSRSAFRASKNSNEAATAEA